MIVTEEDRHKARNAMDVGYNACHRGWGRGRAACDCDLGATDGCKARVEAIAEAIATERNRPVELTREGS